MHVVQRGSGTPLILFHGFGVDHRLLLSLDPVFETAGGWRRLYFDLPGHGRSLGGDVSSAEDLVGLVESEILARLGGESFAVVGTSFGGMVARRVAHDFRRQVLGLALIAPVIVAEHARRNVPDRVVLVESRAVIAGLGDAGEAYAEMAVVQTQANAEAFLIYAYPGISVADQDALKRIGENYALREMPELASPAPFTQPTLFLTAKQDQVVGFQDAWTLLDHYPRATFAVLDAAGHNLHLDQPAITSAFMGEWLHRMRTAR